VYGVAVLAGDGRGGVRGVLLRLRSGVGNSINSPSLTMAGGSPLIIRITFRG
jgi:sulfopyruvate decarboxylase TPP-binding subunit